MLLLTFAAGSVAWHLPDRPTADHPIAHFACRFVACGWLVDETRPFHDLARIGMHGVRLIEHGKKLAFTGYLTNNAEQSQPLPTLVIELSTADGRLVRKHVVNPPNYLSEATNLPMMAGQTHDIKYTLNDPGIVAVQYTIHLKGENRIRGSETH